VFGAGVLFSAAVTMRKEWIRRAFLANTGQEALEEEDSHWKRGRGDNDTR
jgi:hypothetical protein